MELRDGSKQQQNVWTLKPTRDCGGLSIELALVLVGKYVGPVFQKTVFRRGGTWWAHSSALS